jgi:hypothetical protein
MLKLAAERTVGLHHKPAPFVHQKSLGDFVVTYYINADTDRMICKRWCGSGQRCTGISMMLIMHGVQILTPACEGDPKRTKAVPKEWFTAPVAKHGEIPGDMP